MQSSFSCSFRRPKRKGKSVVGVVVVAGVVVGLGLGSARRVVVASARVDSERGCVGFDDRALQVGLLLVLPF